jgi:hypothetical protein
MRERRYLTFDMNNPRHAEALKLFSEQPDKVRSEFAIDCILKAQQESRLEEVIRQTISKALVGVSLSGLVKSETSPKLQSTDNISDLPEALIFAMDDI